MIIVTIKIKDRDDYDIDVKGTKFPPLIAFENAFTLAMRRVLEHQHSLMQKASVEASKAAKEAGNGTI